MREGALREVLGPLVLFVVAVRVVLRQSAVRCVAMSVATGVAHRRDRERMKRRERGIGGRLWIVVDEG